MPRRGKSSGKRAKQDGKAKREPATRATSRAAHADVLDLHRSAGNDAVRGLLASSDERIPHAADRVPTDLDSVLAAEGKPLDAGVRAELEPLVDDHLGDVRVHADAAAAASAEAVEARAYTSGRHLVFGPGEYAPATEEGRSLIAHEVGHAVAAGHGVAGAGAPVLRQPREESKVRPGLSAVPPPQVMTIAGSTFATIHFAHDAFLMDPANFAAVEKLAEQLSFMAKPLVSVDGHASTEGPVKRNDQLARMRREAVVAILRSKAKGGFDIAGSAHGTSQPAVEENATSPDELEAQRARNRRVELMITDLATPQPPAAETPKAPTGTVPPVPSPKVPGGVQPPAPAPTPAPQPQPKGGEGPAKQASVGDLVKAITEVKEVKNLIDEAKEDQLRKVGKLSTPEKVLTGATAAAIVGGALAGVASDPAARKMLLDAVNGKELPVPGVPWLKIQILTKGGPGGELNVDVIKLFKGGR